MERTTKRVAVINDLSGFGRCSLTASIAILSVMGISPCPLPTAVLTNQTAFQNYYRVDLTDEMPQYAEIWQKNGESFDGIFSGYAAGERQLDMIFSFIESFRLCHTRVIVDPVMGDGGSLYPNYGKAACRKMRALIQSADIITPNLTELCILSDTDYKGLLSHSNEQSYLEQICGIAEKTRTHSEQQLVVTGIKQDRLICNAVIAKDKVSIIKADRLGGYFSGTGDIFASVVCAAVLNGKDLEATVKTAADFISEAIDETLKSSVYTPEYGVDFEKSLHKLALNESKRSI